MIAPCKGCEERTTEPNCHTHCMAYRIWREADRLEKEKLETDRRSLMDQESWTRFQQQGGIKK